MSTLSQDNVALHNQLVVNQSQVVELKELLKNIRASVAKEMLGMVVLSIAFMSLLVTGTRAFIFSWKNEVFQLIPAFLVLTSYLEYSFVKSFLKYAHMGENLYELIETQESAIQQAHIELRQTN